MLISVPFYVQCLIFLLKLQSYYSTVYQSHQNLVCTFLLWTFSASVETNLPKCTEVVFNFVPMTSFAQKECLNFCFLSLDVNRILQKSPHMIGNHELQVSRYPPPPQTTSSIEVTGFKPGSTKDSMALYFGNKKKSSGGEVTSAVMEGDRCIVTFASEEGIHVYQLTVILHMDAA